MADFTGFARAMAETPTGKSIYPAVAPSPQQTELDHAVSVARQVLASPGVVPSLDEARVISRQLLRALGLSA